MLDLPFNKRFHIRYRSRPKTKNDSDIENQATEEDISDLSQQTPQSSPVRQDLSPVRQEKSPVKPKKIIKSPCTRITRSKFSSVVNLPKIAKITQKEAINSQNFHTQLEGVPLKARRGRPLKIKKALVME